MGNYWVHMWPLLCPTNEVSRYDRTANIAKNHFDLQFTNETQVSLKQPLEAAARSTTKFWPIWLKLSNSKLKLQNILENKANFEYDGRTPILTWFGRIEFYDILHQFYPNFWFWFHHLEVKECTTKRIWLQNWYFVQKI